MTTDRPIIVFGSGSFASLAAHVLTHDAQRRVLGFTVDVAHLHSATHDGLPVYPFETLVEHAPPPPTARSWSPSATCRSTGCARRAARQPKPWAMN